MKFYCIADEDTVRGFRLAGVPGQVVTTPQQAAEALSAALVAMFSAMLLMLPIMFSDMLLMLVMLLS